MNEDNIHQNETCEELEKEWYNAISHAERELDKKILPLFPLEKQEKINRAYETICEIPDLDERAFVLISYVNELKRVKLLHENLMKKE